MTLVLITLVYAMLLALVIGFAVVLVAELIGRLFTNAPFVPAPGAIADKVAECAALEDGDVFYDLGCGEGHVVRAVAARYPRARAVGVELAPFPYHLARLRTPKKRFPNVTYLQKNMYNVSLKDASCVFIYLLPKALVKLAPQLQRELAPGSRVIACDFPLPQWTPTTTESVGTGHSAHTLYFYTKGAA